MVAVNPVRPFQPPRSRPSQRFAVDSARYRFLRATCALKPFAYKHAEPPGCSRTEPRPPGMRPPCPTHGPATNAPGSKDREPTTPDRAPIRRTAPRHHVRAATGATITLGPATRPGDGHHDRRRCRRWAGASLARRGRCRWVRRSPGRIGRRSPGVAPGAWRAPPGQIQACHRHRSGAPGRRGGGRRVWWHRRGRTDRHGIGARPDDDGCTGRHPSDHEQPDPVRIEPLEHEHHHSRAGRGDPEHRCGADTVERRDHHGTVVRTRQRSN